MGKSGKKTRNAKKILNFHILFTIRDNNIDSITKNTERRIIYENWAAEFCGAIFIKVFPNAAEIPQLLLLSPAHWHTLISADIDFQLNIARIKFLK